MKKKAPRRRSEDSSTAFFATYGVVRHAHPFPAPLKLTPWHHLLGFSRL